MRLSNFRDLIVNMPLDAQAFTAKRDNWKSHLTARNPAGVALDGLFGPSAEEVVISRHDLRAYAADRDSAKFVMATILWGYPNGMRGKNVSWITENFSSLTENLDKTRSTQTISDWTKHYQEVKAIKGVGLSTYTKFLAFLSIKVHGHSALILDDRIVRIFGANLFDEFGVLSNLNSNNREDRYPKYLETMSNVALSLNVSPELLEFFLFEFGLNLKMPAS